MSEHTKKHLTKNHNNLQIQVNDIQYEFKDIPLAKLDTLISFIGDLKPYKTPSSPSSWRNSGVIQELLNEAGGTQDHQTGAVALKGLREDKGLSQKALADLINRDQGVISKMEHCKIPIGKQIAKRFEKIFNVNYKIFLTD